MASKCIYFCSAYDAKHKKELAIAKLKVQNRVPGHSVLTRWSPEAPGSSTLTRSTFFCRSFTRQGDIYWTPAFHWEMIKGLFSPLDLQHLAGGFKLIREALNATSVFTGRLDQDLTFLSHKRFLLFNGGNQHGVESILQRHLVFTMKR